jgi:Leucine rich repeat
MAKYSDDVRQKIDAARRDNQKILDLTLSGLGEIPEEVFEIPHLEVLKLRNNNIQVVPERLRKLPNLRRIDLRMNPIRGSTRHAGTNSAMERIPSLTTVTFQREYYGYLREYKRRRPDGRALK